jgi:hypothetical protein
MMFPPNKVITGDLVMLYDGRTGVIVEEIGLLPDDVGYRRYPERIYYTALVENGIQQIHSGMIRDGMAKQSLTDTDDLTADELMWRSWGDR